MPTSQQLASILRGPPKDPFFANTLLYPCNGNVNDVGPNHYNAVLGNGSFVNDNPFGTPGYQSLKNATDNTPVLATIASPFYQLSALSGAFTIEFWQKVNTSGATGGSSLVLTDNLGTNIDQMTPSNFAANDDRFLPRLFGIPYPGGYTPSPINTGTWQFWSVTRQAGVSGVSNIALNGVLQMTQSAGNNLLALLAFVSLFTAESNPAYDIRRSNIRITKNVDRYPTYPYTPPDKPFPF
jgi:hypothetical protein